MHLSWVKVLLSVKSTAAQNLNLPLLAGEISERMLLFNFLDSFNIRMQIIILQYSPGHGECDTGNCLTTVYVLVLGWLAAISRTSSSKINVLYVFERPASNWESRKDSFSHNCRAQELKCFKVGEPSIGKPLSIKSLSLWAISICSLVDKLHISFSLIVRDNIFR